MYTFTCNNDGSLPADMYPPMNPPDDGPELLSCDYCDAEIMSDDPDADNWREINGDFLCPDCIAELERAAE